jgi:hypothetical protein
MTTETNLPAPQTDTRLAESVEPGSPAEPIGRRQRISVAYLPLALVVFVILAITIAAWTFLAASG